MIVLLTALAPLAAAETTAPPAPALDDLLAGLKATYGETQAIQADFTQTTRSEAFGEGPVQTGQITLGRPRMMRVEFTGDAGSLFLSDGDNLYVYSSIGNQVIITPDLAEKSDGVADLLGNLSALEEQFDITLLSTDDASTELSLTPKSAAQFKSMEMSLTPDYRLTRLSVTDAFDSTTEMKFENMTVDPELPAGVFEFTVPEGAQVIRSDSI